MQTVLKEVDPELQENAVHEQAAKWSVQLMTSTTRDEGYVNVKRANSGRYMATGPVANGSVHLGTYTSPAAAALAVARFKQLMLMQKQPTGPLSKAEEVARKVLYEVNREWTKDVVLTRAAEWGMKLVESRANESGSAARGRSACSREHRHAVDRATRSCTA